MKTLPFFTNDFHGILSDNSGQPAMPLVIALPVPCTTLPSGYMRPSGSLIGNIQRQLNVFINTPRADVEQARTHAWGLLRARGSTRQVDALIEWCCSLMDEWRAHGFNGAQRSDDQLLTVKLNRHIGGWLQRRAEYVEEHGEMLFSFISRGLGEQVRLWFPLPTMAVGDAPTTQTASPARHEQLASPPSSLSPASSSSTSSSDRSSDSSGGSNSSSVPASPASTHSSASLLSHTVSPFSSSLSPSVSPSTHPDSALQLAVMRAAGLRLAYSSFVQHPAFSATAQPFIRVLSSQAFGCWPIPAAWRETFVWTLDEQAVALSVFEQRWGVEVYAPSGGGGGRSSSGSGGGNSGGGSGGGGSRRGSEGGGSGGSSGGGHSGGSSSGSSSGGMQWCNVCVRMQLGSSSEQAEPGSAQVEAAEECGERVLDAVMLAVMQRAKRVEQLVGVP